MSDTAKGPTSLGANFVTAITSEYWALQSARSGTIFESSGRITGFLSTLSSMALDPNKPQMMFTAATMVALINSAVVGVFAGLLVTALFSTRIEIGALAGVLTGAVAALLFVCHENNSWRRAEKMPAAVFPSEQG